MIGGDQTQPELAWKPLDRVFYPLCGGFARTSRPAQLRELPVQLQVGRPAL